jgi:acetyl-CoA synthetase
MYVVTDPGVAPQDLKAVMQKEVRSKLNPLFKIQDVVAVDHLPRTASAKVMRRSLRSDYQQGRA